MFSKIYFQVRLPIKHNFSLIFSFSRSLKLLNHQLLIKISNNNVRFINIIIQKQNWKMKCVSIVYKRPSSKNITPELVPVRSIKRSVDQYLQKLKEKQQQHRLMLNQQNKIMRSQLKTMQTSRQSRMVHQEMPEFINVCRMKYSTENIFKQEGNPQFSQDKKYNKFRTTFVKRKQSKVSYSLKGIKTYYESPIDETKVKMIPNRIQTGNQNTCKLVNLKKLKLAKPNTILISVDFILNQKNFWSQQKIDQTAHKNWKLLQEHSNIVWLTKRQNSSKKLQRYAAEYGLRLDGVYKIVTSKKGQSLVVSLSMFEKDFRMQGQLLKMRELKREVIVINSLRVEEIREVGYEEFYGSFPVVKSLRCVVHYIQVDMEDKHRFNSPLKILSKQTLPAPSSVSHLFSKFYKDHQTNPQQMIQSYMMDLNSIEPAQEQMMTKEKMMEKYEELKQEFVNYFGNHLKVSMSRKLKIEDSECSLQFMIGDMLKRNFNIMYGYQKQCIRIKNRLETIQAKAVTALGFGHQANQEQNDTTAFTRSGNASKMSYDELIRSKLIEKSESRQNAFTRKKQAEKQVYYKQPVFMWKR